MTSLPNIANVQPGQLVYPNYGVLEAVGSTDPSREVVQFAYYYDEDTLAVIYIDGSMESFPLNSGKIDPYKNGFVKFTSNSVNYQIRMFNEQDGRWISKYKISIPESIAKQIAIQANKELANNMPYLQDNVEELVAFCPSDGDYIIGLLYVTKYGPFMRESGTWLGVSPHDTTFDGMSAFSSSVEGAEDLVDLFDSGPLPLEEAKKYFVGEETNG
jgi:hypothetical protein